MSDFNVNEGQDSIVDRLYAVYTNLEYLRQTIISMDLSYSKTHELLDQILEIEEQLTEMELKSNKQQKVEF